MSAPPRSGARSLDRAERILSGAARVFARVDYTDATMDAIAREAETTKQTLYARYGSKEELYRACVEREAERFRAWMFSVYDSVRALPWQARLHASTVAFFRYAAEHNDGFRVLLAQRSGEQGSGGGLISDTVLPRLARDIREYREAHGHRTGASAEVLAAMIVGLNTAGVQRCLADGADLATAGELAAAAVIQVMQVGPDALERLDP